MNRIKYVDTLKFVAIFSIVALHITGLFSSQTIFHNITFENFKEIFRFAVPLFLMITGMLTLNREIELKKFFQKKIIRLCYPLLFFFIIACLIGLYRLDLFFNKFWYCWMVLGVFLAIPLINIFVKNVNETELKYTISLFLISSLIYTLASLMKYQISLDLYFFIGPISYLLLGYYLSIKEFKLSPNIIVIISLAIFILICYLKMHFHNDFLYLHNHNPVHSLLNLSFMQIIQSASIFVLFKYLYECTNGISGIIKRILEQRIINGFIISVSRSSYGIYMFHLIILSAFITPTLSKYHFSQGISTTIAYFIITVGLLLFSWAVIAILGKIPYINKLSGYS